METLVEFTEKSVFINGSEYNKSYLERIMELPMGSLDEQYGNDIALTPLFKIIGEFPNVIDIFEGRFSPESIKTFKEAIKKRV